MRQLLGCQNMVKGNYYGETENHMCVPKKNFFVWRIFFPTKYDDEWLCIEAMTNEAFSTMNEEMTTVNIFPFKMKYVASENNLKVYVIDKNGR